jgi:ubiquinone/menaquinone biosynthesis C-methylase UbiE
MASSSFPTPHDDPSSLRSQRALHQPAEGDVASLEQAAAGLAIAATAEKAATGAEEEKKQEQTPHASHKSHAYTYPVGQSEPILRWLRQRTVANSAAFALPALRALFADVHLKRDNIDEPALMLDVGCGPGTITVGFAEQLGPMGVKVIGLDYSTEVLEEARKLAESRAIKEEHIAFEQGDVFNLRWPDESVRAVYAHQVLMHLPDPVAALKEIKRVLKPQGAVLALREGDMSSMAIYPLSDELKEWMNLWCRVARTSFGTEPDAGRRLKHWALAAGFKEEHMTFSADTYFYTKAAAASFVDTFVQVVSGKDSKWAQEALAGGHTNEESLERIAAAWREWAKQPDAVVIMPHGQLSIKL